MSDQIQEQSKGRDGAIMAISREWLFSFRDLDYGLSRSSYAISCGFHPYAWQTRVLESRAKFKIIDGARQSGKSTIVSVIPAHKAKYKSKSLSLVIAPTRAQANEDMLKIKELMSKDPSYPTLVKNSAFEVTLSNKSRIVVVTATDKAARGYSAPDDILVDEASRVPDTVYSSAILPMQTASPDDFELILISTPFGKQGFFYDCWANSEVYEKFEIKAPWSVDERYPTRLFDAIPEECFVERKRKLGIYAAYSPQHRSYEQQIEILRQQGTLIYKQEFLGEFVDRNDAVFRRADLDRAFFPDSYPPELDLGGPEVRMPAPEALQLKKVVGGKYF